MNRTPIGPPSASCCDSTIPSLTDTAPAEAPLRSQSEMDVKYAIRTESPDHVFVAAHALIFGGVSEPPHLHRFRIRTDLTGVPDTAGCVVDFRQVDRILRELCAMLDHRFLTPQDNTSQDNTSQDNTPQDNTPRNRASQKGGTQNVSGGATAQWDDHSTGSGDLGGMGIIENIDLSIPATSAEFLAKWVAESLRDGLRAIGQKPLPTRLRVELEESTGMYGVCELKTS